MGAAPAAPGLPRRPSARPPAAPSAPSGPGASRVGVGAGGRVRYLGCMELIYGYDPLCGWCYGAVPAMRALCRARPDLPVCVVMSGLVTGPRAGPYAEAEGYIRQAAGRLRTVTGRAPSDAFFALIATPGVRGDSGPPCAAVDAVRRLAPEAALSFAHAVIEAHFEEGADLNDPAAYAPLLERHAPGVVLPDIHDPALAEAAWAEGRALGVSSFPTFALEVGGRREVLPSVYDPARFVALVEAKLSGALASTP